MGAISRLQMVMRDGRPSSQLNICSNRKLLELSAGKAMSSFRVNPSLFFIVTLSWGHSQVAHEPTCHRVSLIKHVASLSSKRRSDDELSWNGGFVVSSLGVGALAGSVQIDHDSPGSHVFLLSRRLRCAAAAFFPAHSSRHKVTVLCRKPSSRFREPHRG